MRRERKTRSAGLRRRNPHARRSARRYKRPIAGREAILRVIAEVDRPLSRERPGITTEQDRESLRRRLNATLRDVQPVCNRRDCHGRADRFDLISGRGIARLDGFAVRGSGGEGVFLSARQMDALFHGTGP